MSEVKKLEDLKKDDPNPANAGSETTQEQERRRTPMSPYGRRRFECRPIPGFMIHVFSEDRVPEALDAGWQFCTKEETHLNQRGVGNPQGLSGNTDLGSLVSVVGNSATNKRGVFMKLKKEWWDEDMRARDERNAMIMGAIFPGEPINPAAPQLLEGNRYMKAAFGSQRGELGNFGPALLNRGRRVAKRPFVPHRPESANGR